MGQSATANRPDWDDLAPGQGLDLDPTGPLDLAAVANYRHGRTGAPPAPWSAWLDNARKLGKAAGASGRPAATWADLRVDHLWLEDPAGAATRPPAAAH